MCGDNVHSNVLTHSSLSHSLIHSLLIRITRHFMHIWWDCRLKLRSMCECNRRRMTLINYAKGCAYSGHMFPQFYTFLFCGRQKVKLLKITIPFCHRAQPPPSIYNHLLFLFFNYKRYVDGNPWPILWFCMIGGLLTIFDTRYQLAGRYRAAHLFCVVVREQ